MRKDIIVAVTIVLVIVFTLYEWYWYIAASSYCTGTFSAQYWGTLACMDDGLLGLWAPALLNIGIAVGLTRLWISSSVPRMVKVAVSAICAAYVVFALFFSMQFWMFEPVERCYWELPPGEPTPPCNP